MIRITTPSFFRIAPRVALALVLAGAAMSAACGRSPLSDDFDGGTDSDATAGDSGSLQKDSGSVIVDAGPDAICPAHYDVYGSTDPSANAGHVDPRLVASGLCGAALEQLQDGGSAPTDFTLTLTQSAPASGMFVTQVHQTTPFAVDRTVCLQSSGPNTGAAGYPDDGGLMVLTDVTEDQIPWDPNLVMFTNMENVDGGQFINIDQSMEAGAAIGNGWCHFVKN